MAVSATEWAWQQSRAKNGSLIVLLAIADEMAEGMAEMTMAQIAAKCRLSERGARDAVRELERLGELAVEPRPGMAARYALCMVDPGRFCPPTPADSAPPANIAPLPFREEPQVSQRGAESAPPGISDVLDLGSVVSGDRRSKPSRRKRPDRPDVERLCAHLAESIIANGSRPPNVGQKWRDAARLLLDKDGRAEDKAHLLIDWCQQDHFWRQNIHSMPTFRRQYDKLRLAAIAEWEKKKRPASNGRQPTPDEFAALRDSWARPLDAMEAGNDPRGNDRAHAVHSRGLPPAAN
jgi:hypothetical protein